MTTSDGPLLPVTVRDLLIRLDSDWRALGVRRRDREALAADLVGDLVAAEADGREPADLVGPDPSVFAAQVVQASGTEQVLGCYQRVVGTGFAAAAVTFVLGWMLLARYVFDRLPVGDHRGSEVAVALVVWCGLAALCLGAVLVAVRAALQQRGEVAPCALALLGARRWAMRGVLD